MDMEPPSKQVRLRSPESAPAGEQQAQGEGEGVAQTQTRAQGPPSKTQALVALPRPSLVLDNIHLHDLGLEHIPEEDAREAKVC